MQRCWGDVQLCWILLLVLQVSVIEGQNCGTPPADPNAATLEVNIAVNEVLTYTCEPGFTNNGVSYQRTCNGVDWDLTAGTFPCEDTDECTPSPSVCGWNGVCSNVPGSYTCECDIGYAWDGSTCTLVGLDVCSTIPCVCDFGSEWDGTACVVTFCGDTPVDPNAATTVTGTGVGAVVTYTCTSGYVDGTPDDTYMRTCMAGGTWMLSGDGPCVDINECALSPTPCGTNSACFNVPGAYTCQCDFGYKWNGNACIINFCGMAPCDPHAVTTVSGFGEGAVITYTCVPGYMDSTLSTTYTRTCTAGSWVLAGGGKCTIDPLLSLIVGVTVHLDWMDDFAERNCDTISSLNIICQEVQTIIGTMLDITIGFLGVAPDIMDHTGFYFGINTDESKSDDVKSAFNNLVQSGRVQKFSVEKTATFLSVPAQDVLIYDVRPGSGPVAGGTPITITGHFLGMVLSVYLRVYDCEINLRNPVLIICQSAKLADSSLVNEPLNISLERSLPLPSLVTDSTFTYLPDPTINDIHPLVTIVTGSVILTVEGNNFLSPKVRKMETTVKKPLTQTVYITSCYGTEQDRMFCMTPDISGFVNGGRRKRDISSLPLWSKDGIRSRRQTSPTLNEELDFDVEIAFILDGVPEYRNLTAANLEEFSELTVYADPVVSQFDPATIKFISTWPIKDRIIEIKGEELLEGLQEKDYMVQIGRAVCSNVKVQSNLIVCEPPLQRPDVAAQDYQGYNKIPVKVNYGSHQSIVGHLEYVQTIWEYQPGRYGIIGGICGFIVLVILIILFILLKRHLKKRNAPQGRALRENSAQEHVNLVRRWGGRRPSRSSTFIPRGILRADTYNQSVSDIRTVPFRTRPGTFTEDGPYNLEDFEPYHTTYRN